MTKRILAILIAAALTAVLSIGALAAPGDLLWSLDAAAIDAFVGGSDNAHDGKMMQAGGPVWSKDGNGLKASMRGNDWVSLDVVAKNVIADGTIYTVIVEFKSDAEQTFRLGLADSPYGAHTGLDGKEMTATGTKATLTLKSDQLGKGVRADTPGTTDDYTIVSARVYEGDPPASSGGGNAKTGDNFVIFGVLGVLALAVCGAFVFYRKAKAE